MKINKLIIDSSESRTDLCSLGVKYPTDKSPYNTESPVTQHGSGHRHPYTAVYDFIFSNIRHKDIKLAEIGILDNMSMKCWREYFTNAKLYGFDFNQRYINEGRDLNLADSTFDFIDVNQTNSIEDSLSKYDKYDIIIEDSTHVVSDQINVMKVAHKYLNNGGILIIEDIFRKTDESVYDSVINEISKYYSTITFVLAEHKLKYSPNWDNDKLLIMYRNNII
jgi:SAM-dependent methyltransferase